MESRKPNAVIVGAPKSGKTSLRYWLSQHPDVFAAPLETSFFSTDVEGGQDRIRTMKQFLSYFEDGQDKKIILNQEARYLVSRVAHKKLKEFNPNAKIIINLRNPAELMFSWHSTLRRIGFETEPDFYKALLNEKERRRKNKGEIIRNYFYREIVDYYPQVKRYIEAFGRQNVKIILLDEIRDKPEETYYELLKFLGLKKITPEFTTQNEGTTEPKNQMFVLFNNILLRLPKFLRIFLKTIISPKLVASIKTVTLKESGVKNKIDPKLRGKINKSFEKNLKKLEKIIDKDLSIWYNQKPKKTT